MTHPFLALKRKCFEIHFGNNFFLHCHNFTYHGKIIFDSLSQINFNVINLNANSLTDVLLSGKIPNKVFQMILKL